MLSLFAFLYFSESVNTFTIHAILFEEEVFKFNIDFCGFEVNHTML